MIRNYLKIAFRNMWKYKTFTFINIGGMAIAFCAVILLAFTAFFELSYDSFHKNKADIYQVYLEQHHAYEADKSAAMPIPLTPAIKAELPAVKRITRYGDFGGSAMRYGDKLFDFDIRCVDADFFKMFTFPIISGNRKDPLADKNDVVLSAKVAREIFGDQYPVGKNLEIKINHAWVGFTVTAVTANAPEGSSIRFGLLCRFEQFPGYAENKDDWNNQSHDVFVQLQPGEKQASFEHKLRRFTAKYFAGTIKQTINDGAAPDNNGDVLSLHLVPLTDIHFNAVTAQARAISKFYPYLILLISVFILFIACTNFINLSLGRAFTRIKEIGVRKVIGATKKQLIIQFCSESFIICGLALFIGALAAGILLPCYKQTFSQQGSLSILFSPLVIAYLSGGFFLISIVAGAYPVWIVAIKKAAQTVNGKISDKQSNGLRNGLMVMQFTLSGLLIICTAITWQQLNYLRNKPLGYNKSEVISVPVGSNIDPDKALSLMRSRLSSYTQIASITGTDTNLGMGLDNSSTTSIMSFNYKGKTVRTYWCRVDEDYVKTLGLQLVNGHDFSGAYASDTSVVLINQKMAAQLGEKDPVGSLLPTDGAKLQVAGVVKDFNFRSLHQQIAPLTMVIRKDWPVSYILVKVRSTSLSAGMSLVSSVWKSINPHAESLPSFLDNNAERQYNKENDLSKVFITGAVLSIVISCMGLFAVVILIITQRTKEIGIRKVLGASVNSILMLISKQFLGLVLASVCIASPIAWYAMNNWLQNFAYHIHIQWWVFALSAIFALAIVLVTISLQVIKAAVANPVKSLRSE